MTVVTDDFAVPFSKAVTLVFDVKGSCALVSEMLKL